jgi:hypothetical protein
MSQDLIFLFASETEAFIYAYGLYEGQTRQQLERVVLRLEIDISVISEELTRGYSEVEFPYSSGVKTQHLHTSADVLEYGRELTKLRDEYRAVKALIEEEQRKENALEGRQFVANLLKNTMNV